jgi:L-asparaginase
MKSPKAKVLVLYTGGTIGMAPADPDNPASPLVPQGKEQLNKWLPRNMDELGIEWNLISLKDDAGETLEPLDSSDVNRIHWQYMARSIGEAYDDYDGFVILHGTDTMAFTAAALSFMFVNLAKPVVVTGSQLPLSSPRTDGVANLVNSLLVAGYRAADLPRIPEVVLVFADVILRGNRARKMSASSWRGFDSPNYPPLGHIGEHIRIDPMLLRPVPNVESQIFYARPGLSSAVIDIGLFPGLSAAQLEALFGLDGLQGVVLRTFGAGNGPSTPEFLDPVGRAVANRLTVVSVTQCPEGKVEAGLYENSSGLLERGVLSGIDMTPEAALTKLMSLLDNEPLAEIGVQMQIDQAGEMSESLFDLRYGNPDDDGNRIEATETGPLVVSATPPGKFNRNDLTRAMLRVSGLEIDGLEDGEVKVVVNHPNATWDIQASDPRFACSLPITKKMLAIEITPTIRRVAEEGRNITLSLVPPQGKGVKVRGLSLALFTGRARV